MTTEQTVMIKKIEPGTAEAEKLLEFVKTFSWEAVKEHAVKQIGAWAFTDWEAPFTAIAGGRIVGMATIMKTDYYPLPEIFPWISTVFVSEDFRGRRISERLIAFANAYAKELGFTKTYIPAEIIGLYEKYGYRYVRDIVNYGNGVDRLYEKEI